MFLFRNLIKSMYFLLVILFLAGCALPQPKTPEQIVQASLYAGATKNVMEKLKDKKYSVDYIENRIVIQQYISGEKGGTDQSIDVAISAYNSRYDASNDEISAVFIESAKQRGSIVKMYKKSVNLALVKVIPMPWDITNYPSRGDIDVAFVEYDKNNRIASVLVRAHAFPKSLGVLDYRYSIIAFGNIARQIESTVKNNVFTEGYITTIN